VAGNNILLIDPDAASRNFVSNTLRQEQYNVVQSGSAKEGLIVAWRDRPDLIIIEPRLADIPGEELAARLRHDPRTQQVPLLALSADNRATRMKSCLDAGFNEYIVKSGEAIPLLIAAVDRLTGNVPDSAASPSRHNAYSFIFLSAKGGIGTTSLCVNLAMNMADNQPNELVGLVDLVLPIGSIASVVGYEGPLNLVHVAALSARESREIRLVEPPLWRFHLLPGSPDPDSANQLQVSRIAEIMDNLRTAYDYLVVDLGRSLSKFALPLIQQADLVVMTISTDLNSIKLTRTLLDFLHLKGIEDRSIFPILNRAVGLEGLTRAETEKALGLEIKTTIPYLPHFTLANNQHQPFSLKYPNDTAAVAFRDVAGQMVARARQLRVDKEHS